MKEIMEAVAERVARRSGQAGSGRGRVREDLEAIRGMTYWFHPEAEEEFLAAIDYYEHREERLGFDFAVEVYAAIELLSAKSLGR